jgi:hypothetical protein
MGLMANYKPNLPRGEAWDRALNLKEARLRDGQRGRLIKISVPDAPKAMVQVFPGGSITIFCPDLEELHKLEAWLNKRLGTPDNSAPLGRAVNVKRMGSRSAYYETPEEVIERLTLDPGAVSIMNLDKELENHPPGSQEKIELLSAAAEAVGRLLGSLVIPAFERAVEAETVREAVRILVKSVPPAFDDFASYFLWLLREHRDVAPEALRRANRVIKQPTC